jgi:hypothetical protein
MLLYNTSAGGLTNFQIFFFYFEGRNGFRVRCKKKKGFFFLFYCTPFFYVILFGAQGVVVLCVLTLFGRGGGGVDNNLPPLYDPPNPWIETSSSRPITFLL